MANVHGSSSADSLAGTAGNDSIYGAGGSDYISGSAGNDLINAGYRTSAIYWRYGFVDADFDMVDYSRTYQSYALGSTTAIKIVADLELGTVKKYNAAGTLLNTDTLIGVDGISGTDAADTLRGRDTWDYEVFSGNGGNDLIDGRGGDDEADYSAAGAGIVVKMAAGTVTGASTGTDTLRQIEYITGTRYTDTYDARGFGAKGSNHSSFASPFNIYKPLAGDDIVQGNGETSLAFSVGGAVTVDLSGQTSASASAHVVTSGAVGVGDVLASGVNGVRSGGYDDRLLGGGRVNSASAGIGFGSVSTDKSYELFRGRGGNDFIDGRTGFDRAQYRDQGQSEGIVARLAAGTVTGDQNVVGTDTLRGIEAIDGTYLDDVYDARGFTLSNAVAKSVNSGDVKVTLPAGETLASLAYNEFRPMAGIDTIKGNGATRLNFGILVETESASAPTVILKFTGNGSGSGSYGVIDGGFGSVTFTGVYSVRGSSGNDSISGSTGFQQLLGEYGNDTLLGGAGADILYGLDGGANAGAATTPGTIYTDNDRLDGGAGNDLLRGDLGQDLLLGGSGNDTLQGGVGKDTLTGGTGNDRFRFVTRSEGVDTINDFVHGQDKIAVVAANFGLVSGAAARVVVNGAATTSAATFIYTSSTGTLAFDADGNGVGAAVSLAILSTKPATFAAADIVVGA